MEKESINCKKCGCFTFLAEIKTFPDGSRHAVAVCENCDAHLCYVPTVENNLNELLEETEQKLKKFLQYERRSI